MQASVRSSFILRRTALAGLFAGVLALGGCAALQPQTAEQIARFLKDGTFIWPLPPS